MFGKNLDFLNSKLFYKEIFLKGNFDMFHQIYSKM